MPGELQVGVVAGCFFEVVGLVVEHDGGQPLAGRSVHELPEGHAPGVGAVVAPDEAQASADDRRAVAQEMDAGLADEADGAAYAGYVLVVAGHGIDPVAALYLAEEGCEAVVQKRAHVAVDDVAHEEHGVGLLAVDEGDPFLQFGGADGVAEVEVAECHDGHRFAPWAALGEVVGKLAPLLVAVVEIAVGQDIERQQHGKGQADGAGQGAAAPAHVEQGVGEVACRDEEEEVDGGEKPSGAHRVERPGLRGLEAAAQGEGEDEGERGRGHEQRGHEPQEERAGHHAEEAQGDVGVHPEEQDDGEDHFQHVGHGFRLEGQSGLLRYSWGVVPV